MMYEPKPYRVLNSMPYNYKGPDESFKWAVLDQRGLASAWCRTEEIAATITAHMNGQCPTEGKSVPLVPAPPRFFAYDTHSHHDWAVFDLELGEPTDHNLTKAAAKDRAALSNSAAVEP